jgi:hypothetical protein
MIKNNQDQSLSKQLRKEITRLLLALSEKYSSECCMDSLIIYPSLFHSINEESCESGYSSNRVFSWTDDTADSDWQLSEKNACRRTAHSTSDTASHLTSDHDAHHHTSLHLNYVPDFAI